MFIRAHSGLKPIEEVEQGELVWAADPLTREWSLQEVVEPLVHEYVGDLISLEAAGLREISG